MEASTQTALAPSWPISLADVSSARDRIRPYFGPTPLRNYAPLDRVIGKSIQLWVKHENHCPTNSFKVRNALSLMTALRDEEKVSENEIAEGVRAFLSKTHNLAEGAGAAGLAGAIALRDRLAGKSVAIVLSGGNIDRETLRRVIGGEIA